MENKKKTTTKKPAAKKETVKKEAIKNNKVIVKNQPDYTTILNRILYALIVIGILLALNLCVNLINGTKKNENTATTQKEEEDIDYDVSEFETLTTTELVEKIKAGGTQVVYIGRSTCGYCVKFLPIMKQAQADLGYKTIYVNLEEMTSSDAETLYEYNSYIEENFGYTPMVLVFRDGSFVKGSLNHS